MDEKILISIQVDQAGAIKNTADLDNQIKDLTKSNKELAKSEGDNSIKIAENNALIRSLNAEKREQTKLVDQSIKAFKSESGSLTQQKAQLAVLTQQYNNLSEEERLNSDIGRKLASDVLALTNNLKSQESAVGDNRRNVGNYSQALNVLEKSLAEVNAKIIANSQNGKGNAADMDKLSKEAEILNGLVERQSQGFGKATQELKENTAALQKMKAAGLDGTDAYKKLLKTTGDLKDEISDLKDGINTFKGSGVEKLNASFGQLQQGIANFDTDALKQGFKGLGAAMTAIPIFLILEGVKLLWENFDKVKEAVSKFIPALKETVNVKKELNEASLEGAKNAAVERANLDNLYKAATDQTKSLSEREKAQISLQETYPLTFKNFTDEQFALGLAKKGYDELSKSILDASMIKAKQGLLDKKAMEFAEEEQKRLNEIADLKAELNSLSKEANVINDIESHSRQVLASDYDAQMSKINHLIKINDDEAKSFKKKNADILGDLTQHQEGANKIAAEASAAAELLKSKQKSPSKIDKAKKDEEQRLQDIAQFKHDLDARQIQTQTDSISKELALFDLKAKQEMDAAIKNHQDIKKLDEVQGAERDLIWKKWRDKDIADSKTAADKVKADKDKAYQDQVSQTDEFFKVMDTKRAEQLASGNITKAQFDQQTTDAEALRLQAQLELAKKSGQETVDLENQISHQKIDISKETAERQLAIDKQKSDRQLQMIKDISDAATSIISSSYDQQGFNFQKFKKQFILGLLDMLQKVIAVQIASATITSLSSPQSIATGGALGVTQAAILTGLMNIAFAIAKAEISRAGGGGDFVTSGPTLMMVGDNPGGAERVQVTPLSGKGQTYINPSSGLHHFAGGGTLSTDGGFGTRASTSQAMSDASIFQVTDAIANMKQPVLQITTLERIQERSAEISALATI